ncbi:hypothetical protein HQ487_00905 [Candidatus Uhrbacteria bacterium]|nr:hypothetical protein [Candidatus Uhrbacteria bacterium]
MSIEHKGLHKEMEASWEEQERVIRSVLDQGIEAYTASLEGLSKAFETEDHTLCCIDEGAPFGDMRSAGSGILLEGEERTVFIQKLKDAGVKEVTSHEACGAAGLYREQKGITDKSVKEVAVEGAQRMAQDLGVPYKGHIEKLTRPMDFHNARVIYIDGTGSFNPSALEGLPQGFVISRRFMTPTQASAEAGIAMSIALGDHGFGKKFTHKEPLLIVVIGESNGGECSVEKIQSEMEQLLVFHTDAPVKMDSWNYSSKQESQSEKQIAA